MKSQNDVLDDYLDDYFQSRSGEDGSLEVYAEVRRNTDVDDLVKEL